MLQDDRTVTGGSSAKAASIPADGILPPRLHAASAGLVYVDEGRPGIARLRKGRGFSYRNPDGSIVCDRATLARIRALAIPPAYTDVWICRDPSGHIQATARDQRGRKQYRYHKDWHAVRDADKFARLVAFARSLPTLRATIEAHMGTRGMGRDKVLATVVHLLDRTLIRVGNAEYARGNDSYGLTTLQNRHIAVNGTTLRFSFKGKSGKTWQVKLADRRIVRIVRAIQELPGQDLFQYIDDDGIVRDVDSTAVNAYIRAIAGEGASAKDFRTWAATVHAACELNALGPSASKREALGKLRRAVARVAERLGNTVAVCRKSYVHPHVIDGYLTADLCKGLAAAEARMADDLHLTAEERMVLCYLSARAGG